MCANDFPGPGGRYDLGVRRLLLGTLGLTLLVGCGVRPAASPVLTATSSQSMSTSTSTPLPAVMCSAEGVGFSVLGPDGAMGLRSLTIEMVNCGSRPFTVDGYPSLRLFDEERKPIDVVVARGSGAIAMVPEFDNPPQAVVLRPGEKAMAGMLWRNLVTDATVKATTAVYLDAALAEGRPWQKVPLVVPSDVSGAMTVSIDLGNTGTLGVQAWTKA